MTFAEFTRCLDCGARLPGWRRRYCDTCNTRRNAERLKRWRDAHLETVRADHAAYMRDWRAERRAAAAAKLTEGLQAIAQRQTA